MPKNNDPAHEETERLLAEMEKKVAREYKQAAREAESKLNDYMEDFKEKDSVWKKMVEDGQKTEKEYEDWRFRHMAVGKRWENLKDTLAEDYLNADKAAKSIINGYMPEVYATNFNYGTYEAEAGANVNTGFTLYDKQTVERLMRDNPDMLPQPGKKVSKAIAEGKAVRWNKNQIQSVMTQGILQGESIPKLARRLASEVADKDYRAAVRNARTMTTGAQNAGRVDSYERAEEMGIDMEQEWRATLDGRTRHTHALMDGETQKVGDAFSNGLMYPGDPSGEPEEVYNCRCTLRAIVVGLQPMARQYRSTEDIDGMTYDEWKDYHRHALGEETTDSNETKSIEINLGNAENILGDAAESSREYAERLSNEDIEKFNDVFSKINFVEGEDGAHYNPSDHSVTITKDGASNTTVYHESTHWFDYEQKYTIQDDWGGYKKVFDDDGNIVGKEWKPNIVTIKENASFSEYIYQKWDRYERDSDKSLMQKDTANFVKILGMSDTYGNNRNPDDVRNDLDAVKSYLEKKGISRSDPDYVHLSDFISAMSFDASLGSLVTGGHSYDYWVMHGEYRVSEITAGYNILRAIGREDMLEIERELAPNLMDMIEKEWSKIW